MFGSSTQQEISMIEDGGGSGSQVQADRASASIAIAEAQAEMVAQQVALEQQKSQERTKLMKLGMYGLGALVLLKVLKK